MSTRVFRYAPRPLDATVHVLPDWQSSKPGVEPPVSAGATARHGVGVVAAPTSGCTRTDGETVRVGRTRTIVREGVTRSERFAGQHGQAPSVEAAKLEASKRPARGGRSGSRPTGRANARSQRTRGKPIIGAVKSPISFRAPTRLDFGGGWTDVPPYDVEQGGFVCNVAISRYATVRLTPLPDDAAQSEIAVAREGDAALLRAVSRRYDFRGASISLSSDFPVAAGLGGSSAAGVAAITAALAWHGQSKSKSEIAEASRELEVLEMGIAGGRQDHYAAAHGGALGLRFGKTVEVTRIPLTPAALAEIPRRCIVVYTGESRISATTITAVMGAYRDQSRRVRDALREMKSLAEQSAIALEAGNLDQLGRLVGEQWEHQRSLDPAIPTPLIDRMIATAMSNGAIGCKALGASGGGCVLMIAAEGRSDDVRAAVSSMGTEITYTVDTTGVAPAS